MKRIDLDTWDRREHYLFFRGSDCAHYHIGTDLDITRFREETKERGIPFSFAMTYAVTAAMNGVEQFRYRVQDGDVVLHDTLHPYFAYIAPDKRYFKMVLAEMEPDIRSFAAGARKKALEQEAYFLREDTRGRSDLIFISSIPNVAFTHLSHTMTLNKDDAVPRLSWGKFTRGGGRVTLPFNLQAHHAFVDGDHMGRYLEALQIYLHDCPFAAEM